MNYPMPSADMYRSGPSERASSATTFSFPRSGQRPLVFRGSSLAMAMSFTPEIPFWYEINIFRTEDQTFVLAVKLFFQSETEKDTVRAWSFDTIEALFQALEDYDAAEDIRLGFSETEGLCPAELVAMAYELKAKVEAYRAHWSSLVGELFMEIESLDHAIQ